MQSIESTVCVYGKWKCIKKSLLLCIKIKACILVGDCQMCRKSAETDTHTAFFSPGHMKKIGD